MLTPTRPALPEVVGRLTALQWLAAAATLITLVVYALTALRGVSFGDSLIKRVVETLPLFIPRPVPMAVDCPSTGSDLSTPEYSWT